jgi:hypothetical protein
MANTDIIILQEKHGGRSAATFTNALTLITFMVSRLSNVFRKAETRVVLK